MVLPNSKIRPDPFSALGEHVVERVGEQLDLVVAGDERRQELDDVHVVGGDLGEDAVAVEERHDDHLREQRGAQRLDDAEAPPQGRASSARRTRARS